MCPRRVNLYDDDESNNAVLLSDYGLESKTSDHQVEIKEQDAISLEEKKILDELHSLIIILQKERNHSWFNYHILPILSGLISIIIFTASTSGLARVFNREQALVKSYANTFINSTLIGTCEEFRALNLTAMQTMCKTELDWIMDPDFIENCKIALSAYCKELVNSLGPLMILGLSGTIASIVLLIQACTYRLGKGNNVTIIDDLSPDLQNEIFQLNKKLLQRDEDYPGVSAESEIAFALDQFLDQADELEILSAQGGIFSRRGRDHISHSASSSNRTRTMSP